MTPYSAHHHKEGNTMPFYTEENSSKLQIACAKFLIWSLIHKWSSVNKNNFYFKYYSCISYIGKSFFFNDEII